MPAPTTSRYDADILELEKQRTDRERARKQKAATKKGQTSDLRSFEKEADRRSKILAQFVELTGKSKLTNLTQEDLAFYRDCLDRIPKNYNKSPEDRALPIDRILERGDDLPARQVGLSAASINRNFGFLKLVIEQGALAGLSPATPVNIGILRETEGLQREARLAFSQEDIKRIFAHPNWHGRRSAKRMNQPGNEIVKDALYWMPLLGCYTGCRREELAGMEIKDVRFDHHIPYFDIRPNSNRGLKNAQSERLVPIHPHLMELGFPEYVSGYTSIGESDLFPDLRPTNTDSTSFGDALHYRWSKVLEHTLGSDGDRKVFHSFRHYVSTYLQNVLHANSLVTKDILGHLAGDITSDRYRDSAPLDEKLRVIQELPRVF